jgi:hypothetical protein
MDRIGAVPGAVAEPNEEIEAVLEDVGAVVVRLQAQIHMRVLHPERLQPWQQPADGECPDDADREDFAEISFLELAEGGAHALEGVGQHRQ